MIHLTHPRHRDQVQHGDRGHGGEASQAASSVECGEFMINGKLCLV